MQVCRYIYFKKRFEYDIATEKSNTKPDGLLDKDVVASKLEQGHGKIPFFWSVLKLLCYWKL
ncbi:hypothetical protein MKX01_028973 [Papaver californicum]|nr:hypothetical protein MKX01_028973 [Papaver californicum]